MLDAFLSFSGRLRRLEYFLRSLALFAAEMALFIVAAGLIFAMRGAGLLAIVFAGLLALVAAPLFIWSGLALQARRLRDMGWEPLYVIPAWMVALIIDAIFASKGTLSAAAPSFHTGVFGALLNLAMSGCLLFWPSKNADAGGGSAAPAAPTYQPWTPMQAPSASAPTGFGRRGA